MGSHQVPNVFPKGVSNSTLLKPICFLPKVLPFFSVGRKGEALHFSIEIFYFWEPPQFCFFGDGTTKLTRCKKRKKKKKSRTCEAPQLIYMKANISMGGFIMGVLVRVLGRVFLGGAISPGQK